MKKLFTRILPLLLIALLAGCNDDDNKPSNSVIGTWQFIGFYDYTQEKFNPINSECTSETTVFSEDGTGTSVFTDCEQGNGGFSFLWEKADAPNIYNQTIEDIIYQVNVTFEDSNKMYLSYADDNAKVYVRVLEE